MLMKCHHFNRHSIDNNSNNNKNLRPLLIVISSNRIAPEERNDVLRTMKSDIIQVEKQTEYTQQQQQQYPNTEMFKRV